MTGVIFTAVDEGSTSYGIGYVIGVAIVATLFVLLLVNFIRWLKKK